MMHAYMLCNLLISIKSAGSLKYLSTPLKETKCSFHILPNSFLGNLKLYGFRHLDMSMI